MLESPPGSPIVPEPESDPEPSEYTETILFSAYESEHLEQKS